MVSSDVASRQGARSCRLAPRVHAWRAPVATGWHIRSWRHSTSAAVEGVGTRSTREPEPRAGPSLQLPVRLRLPAPGCGVRLLRRGSRGESRHSGTQSGRERDRRQRPLVPRLRAGVSTAIFDLPGRRSHLERSRASAADGRTCVRVRVRHRRHSLDRAACPSASVADRAGRGLVDGRSLRGFLRRQSDRDEQSTAGDDRIDRSSDWRRAMAQRTDRRRYPQSSVLDDRSVYLRFGLIYAAFDLASGRRVAVARNGC